MVCTIYTLRQGLSQGRCIPHKYRVLSTWYRHCSSLNGGGTDTRRKVRTRCGEVERRGRAGACRPRSTVWVGAQGGATRDSAQTLGSVGLWGQGSGGDRASFAASAGAEGTSSGG